MWPVINHFFCNFYGNYTSFTSIRWYIWELCGPTGQSLFQLGPIADGLQSSQMLLAFVRKYTKNPLESLVGFASTVLLILKRWIAERMMMRGRSSCRASGFRSWSDRATSSAPMADGLSVWLVRRSGIPCRTACGIRLLAGIVSDNLWKRFCSQRTNAFSALQVSRRCAI